MKPAKTLLLLLVTLLLTTCEKPSRDNPWDELAGLDPQSWAPKNLKIESPSITQRIISWEYSNDDRIEGFKIDRKRGGEDWILSFKDLEKTIRRTIDTITINPLVEYQYRVFTYAGKNRSSFADTKFNATVPTPINLTFIINSSTSITLSWDYFTSGHEGFQLERKINEEAWIIIESKINPDSSNYTNDQINLDQNDYAYRLKAYFNSFYSDYTPAVTVKSQTVINPITGKTWMDRNLGAGRVAQSSTDAEAYGDLYQWGRLKDGHEKRNSFTTNTLSNSNNPGHGNFIIVNTGNYDWRSPQNNDLWQGVNGANNPCPLGFRLPTEAEWEAERQSWSSIDNIGAFNSFLKLPLAGRRYGSGSLGSVGLVGNYWSSTVSGKDARNLYFDNTGSLMYSFYRAFGYSVRCIKD